MEDMGLTSLAATLRLEMQSAEYRQLLSNIGKTNL